MSACSEILARILENFDYHHYHPPHSSHFFTSTIRWILKTHPFWKLTMCIPDFADQESARWTIPGYPWNAAKSNTTTYWFLHSGWSKDFWNRQFQASNRACQRLGRGTNSKRTRGDGILLISTWLFLDLEHAACCLTRGKTYPQNLQGSGTHHEWDRTDECQHFLFVPGFSWGPYRKTWVKSGLDISDISSWLPMQKSQPSIRKMSFDVSNRNIDNIR
jgi:hypothetical protein